MNSNVSIKEKGKLLAAFAVLAMVVCAFAAVMPADSVDAVVADDDVAYIGDTGYDTLQDAVNAANDGDVIYLNTAAATDGVIQGNGVVFNQSGVLEGKSITVDFNGLTYDVNPETVGSDGTETNGFQLLQGCAVTLTKGTIISTSNTARILLQNYCDLTLDDFVADGSGNNLIQYTSSNNNGSTTLMGDTRIIASTNGVAFDVCGFASYYDGVSVTIDESFTGTISGEIEMTSGNGVVPVLNINGTVEIGDLDGQAGVVNVNETGNVTVTGNVNVVNPINLDGGSITGTGTITGTGGHVIDILYGGGSVSGVTIDASGANGAIQTYALTGDAVIDGVTIEIDAGSSTDHGIYVNQTTETGSVTINNVTFDFNGSTAAPVNADVDENTTLSVSGLTFDNAARNNKVLINATSPVTVGSEGGIKVSDVGTVALWDSANDDNTFTVAGTLEVDSTMNVTTNGQLIVPADASVVVAEGAALNIASGSSMAVETGGSVTGAGSVQNDGTVTGTVDVDDYENSGVVLSADGTIAYVETIEAFRTAIGMSGVQTVMLDADIVLDDHTNTNGKKINLNGNDLTLGTYTLNAYDAGVGAITVPAGSTLSFSGMIKVQENGGLVTESGSVVVYAVTGAAFYNTNNAGTASQIEAYAFTPRFADGTIVVMDGYSYTTTTITTSNGATIMIGVNGVEYDGNDYAGPNGTIVATVIDSWPENATITPFSEQYRIYDNLDNADAGNTAYGKVQNAGTYYIRMGFTVDVNGNLATPYVVAQFVITPRDIADADIADIPTQNYNGQAIEPMPEISFNGMDLVYGKDFTLSYANNNAEGTATITITGIGNYAGTTTVYFEIADIQKYLDELEDFIGGDEGLGKQVPGAADGITYAMLGLEQSPNINPDSIYGAIYNAYQAIWDAETPAERQQALEDGKYSIVVATKETIRDFLATVYNYSDELSGPNGYMGMYMSTELYESTLEAIGPDGYYEPKDIIRTYENALAERTALPLTDLYNDLESWIVGGDGYGPASYGLDVTVPGSTMTFVEVPQINAAIEKAYEHLRNAQTITGAQDQQSKDKTEILVQTKDYVRYLLETVYNDGNGYMGMMMSEQTYNDTLEAISATGALGGNPADVVMAYINALNDRQEMHTVTFYVNGEVYATVGFVGENQDISDRLPAAPIVTGMAFVDWVMEDGITAPDFTDVSEDMSVYARFTIEGSLFGDNFSFGYMFSDENADPYNATLPWFVVNYQRVYDNTVITITVDDGSFTQTTADGMPSNYAAYWLLRIGEHITPGQHTITLTATLGDVTESRTFTVNVIDYVQVIFQDQDGNNVDVKYPVNGTAITLPNMPAIDGYEFAGWAVDGNVVGTAGDMYTVHGETVLTAVYNEVSPSYDDPVVIINGIPTSFVTGQEYVFSVSTIAGDSAGISVQGKGIFTAPEGTYTVWYLENNPTNERYGEWIELTGDIFGDSDGFPLIDTTSYFKVVFNQAGNYDLTVQMKDMSGNVLCDDNAKIIVLDASDLPEYDDRAPRQLEDYYLIAEVGDDGKYHIYVVTDKWDTSVYRNALDRSWMQITTDAGYVDMRIVFDEVGMYDEDTLIVADYAIDLPHFVSYQGYLYYADTYWYPLGQGMEAGFYVSEITLSPTEINMTVGQETDITAKVGPESAVDKTIVWTSSNPALVSVDENGHIVALGYTDEPVTITASVGDVSATCTVNVKEMTGLQIVPPTKTQYYAGERLDTTGLKVNAVYSDGSTEPVTGYTIDTDFLNTPGMAVPVTITYMDFDKSFTVTVGAVSGINIQLPGTLVAGTTLTADDLNIEISYSNGLPSRAPMGEVTFNPVTVQVGDTTLTVSYTEAGFSTQNTFQITVVEQTETTE